MDPHLTQLAVVIIVFAFAESHLMPGPPGFSGLPPPPGPPRQRFQQQRRKPMSPAMRQLNQAAFMAAAGGNDKGKQHMAFEFIRQGHPCLVDQVYKSVAMEIADIPPMAAAGFRGDPMTAIAVQKLSDIAKRRAAMKAFANPCFKQNPGLLSLVWDYADLPVAALAMKLGMGNPMG